MITKCDPDSFVFDNLVILWITWRELAPKKDSVHCFDFLPIFQANKKPNLDVLWTILGLWWNCVRLNCLQNQFLHDLLLVFSAPIFPRDFLRVGGQGQLCADAMTKYTFGGRWGGVDNGFTYCLGVGSSRSIEFLRIYFYCKCWSISSRAFSSLDAHGKEITKR